MSTRKENMTTKKCKNCNVIKSLSKFWKKKRNRDNHETICGECKSLIQKEKRKNNPEMFLKSERKYEIKRKAKKSNGEMPHRIEAMRLRYINSGVIRRLIKGIGKQKTFLNNYGCTKQAFINRFERYFKKNPGMGWHNYGLWHMDHIKPLKNFELNTESSKKLANHYTNLRPEWAKVNLGKGAKYIEQNV